MICALPLSGYCADGAATAKSPACPGAAAWQEAHPEELPAAVDARDAARHFTLPELRRELETRFALDQKTRRTYLSAPLDPQWREAVLRMDAANLIWLKQLIRTTGVPTAEQVGENGVKWTWLLVQHADADPTFQASVVPEFARRFEAGELSADAFAKLSDRVLVAAGKPQEFGTQFDWLYGHFDPKGSVDLAAIDARRRKIGLMPLADYACLVNQRLKDR
jgi:hypothetical protein